MNFDDDDDVLSKREREKMDAILRVLDHINKNPDDYRVTVNGDSGGFVIDEDAQLVSFYIDDDRGFSTVHVPFKNMSRMKLGGKVNHIVKVKDADDFPVEVEIVRVEPVSFWEIGT